MDKLINIFPENVLDFPSCYTEQELEELEGSYLKELAKKKK